MHYNSITMVMDVVQVRLNRNSLTMLDQLVNKGIYSSRSEAVRDAVRRFIWENELGSVKLKGNGVALVRKAREKLSKQKINLNEINSL